MDESASSGKRGRLSALPHTSIRTLVSKPGNHMSSSIGLSGIVSRLWLVFVLIAF
jgi:hypothetical protein